MAAEVESWEVGKVDELCQSQCDPPPFGLETDFPTAPDPVTVSAYRLGEARDRRNQQTLRKAGLKAMVIRE